jgi:low affinity Fe/Cu permease
MKKSLQQLLTSAGMWLSRPWVIGLVVLYAVLWLIFDRSSLDWHGIVSLATLSMTLFIQRAEHRDTQAIHAKLDELLRVHGDARNQLTRLDDKEPEQVEAFRNKVREETEKCAPRPTEPRPPG